MQIAVVDWILLGVLLASVLLGAWRGLVYEVVSALGWVAAFVLAQWFAPEVSARLPMSGATETVRYAAAFAVVFIACAFAAGLLAWLTKKLVEAIGLRPVDRYPTLFVDTSRDMAVGDLRVVRSGAGLHVLKLIEKRISGMPATTVEQTLASHILLRPSAQLSEAQARERLNGFRTRIVSGQVEFAALAREFSQDGSASQGGELGWAVPGQFVPEFEDVMNALAPGEVSEPFTSRFGVHLMTVKQRRVVPLTPREQREAVRGRLREKKVDDAFATWAQELRARAYVEMRDPPG